MMAGTEPAQRPLLAIAHRAGNSIAGLRTALELGVDLVETDVHHYRQTLEVRHLKTLGSGLLWDRWQLVRRRDAVLPDLREVLAAMNGDARLMLDLKGVDRALAPAVAALLRAAAPEAPVAVCTQHWWMLDAFAGDPHVRLMPSAGSQRGLRRLRARLREHPADGVSIRLRLLTPQIVDELHRNAELVLAWAVDTPAELARARRLGVSGIISKNPSILREVLRSR